MKNLPEKKRRKLVEAVNQLRGQVFTFRDSNGKCYKMVVHGIQGDHLVLRQVQAGSSRSRVRLFPFFLIPFFFFYPFL